MIQNLKKTDDTSNYKVKLLRESIVVIEEDWFSNNDITDSATFPTDLIKSAKYRFNKKINVPYETKQRIWEIAINNS